MVSECTLNKMGDSASLLQNLICLCISRIEVEQILLLTRVLLCCLRRYHPRSLALVAQYLAMSLFLKNKFFGRTEAIRNDFPNANSLWICL